MDSQNFSICRVTWEVSSLEETQNETKRDQNNPIVDEAEANLQIVSVEIEHIKVSALTMTAPQATQRVGRKILGPILYVTTVAGGWKMVYVMKKTRVAIEYR